MMQMELKDSRKTIVSAAALCLCIWFFPEIQFQLLRAFKHQHFYNFDKAKVCIVFLARMVDLVELS